MENGAGYFAATLQTVAEQSSLRITQRFQCKITSWGAEFDSRQKANKYFVTKYKEGRKVVAGSMSLDCKNSKPEKQDFVIWQIRFFPTSAQYPTQVSYSLRLSLGIFRHTPSVGLLTVWFFKFAWTLLTNRLPSKTFIRKRKCGL